ncbi:MAG: alpha/beta hydrolase [Gaiellaceae bacterium]
MVRYVVAALVTLMVMLMGAGGAGADPILPLEPCTLPGPVRALCGTLDVWEDRDAQAGRRISLRVAVVPATRQAAARVPLFYLAGGPGGAATASGAFAAGVFRQRTLTQDLVFVDQRGTGASNRLTCPPAPPQLISSATPAAIAAYVEGCLAGLDGDPRFYTTAVAMDDLDDVRAALGYDRIDLYGGSYGATALQVYLARHGGHVRAAIMDGASLVDVPIFELWAANGQRAIDLIFERCSASRACRTAFPSPGKDMERLLGRLQRKPQVVKLGPLGTVRVTRRLASSVIQQLSRTAAGAAELPLAVHQGARGDLTVLARTYAREVAPQEEGARLVMYWSIVCSEPWARFSETETARLGTGSYLGPTRIADAKDFAAACAHIPRGVVPDDAGTRVRSDVPVLALAGGADPQDPPRNIAGVEKAMPNARVVVARGMGHGVVQNSCVSALANRFLARGTAAGLDVTCAARVPLPPFVLS